MKKLVLITSLFCLTSVVVAQEDSKENEPKRFNHSLGFGAGVSTGYGLSYRYFGDKLGAQVNFSPYKDEYRTNVSLGLTFLYRIVEVNEFTFFVYQGNHFYYNKDSHVYTDYNYNNVGAITNSKEVTHYNEENYFNNGIGMGLEWNVSDRIGLNTMAGYGMRENFKKIGLTGEIAAYFRF